MKNLLCFLLCLTLIFSSVSLCFAVDWSTTDQQNLSYAASRLYTIQQLLSSGGSLYSLINTISNNVNTIKGYLIDSNTSVAGWLHNINTWMSPIYNSITAIPVDISTIIGALGYFTDNGTTYHPYLNELHNALSNTFNQRSDGNGSVARSLAHSSLFVGGDYSTLTYPVLYYEANGSQTTFNQKWGNGTPLGNIMLLLRYFNSSFINAATLSYTSGYNGFNVQQSGLSWLDIEQSISFTPQSATDGIYKWLKNIQAPVARLSYVLASDERIEAQEAAAANEQAVVDNFIDSTGDGAASTSDFDSIASFSDGYKNTFTSDASPTAIFSIFNSDNMGWFSQETKNQLDTTNTRNSKSSNSFTPLLDKQIEDIYNSLGVKLP